MLNNDNILKSLNKMSKYSAKKHYSTEIDPDFNLRSEV